MSGAGRRSVKASGHPARPPDKPAADKRSRAPGPPAKAAPKSPQARGKKSGGAAALQQPMTRVNSEARDMAEAVANNGEGNNNPTPPVSPPPMPRKEDRAVTLELNKVQAERAKLQAETERLRKELDNLVQEKKRKESVAAEPAPRKRAVGISRIGEAFSTAEHSCFSKEASGIYFNLGYLFHNLVILVT